MTRDTRVVVGALLLLSAIVQLSACSKAPSPQQARAAERASSRASGSDPATPRAGSYGPAAVLATLKDTSINESSGLVASRLSPGIYWTHNDSGDGPFIYALDVSGSSRGVWRVAGAQARDWEDIAAGPGPESDRPYLYIGDIGDNDATRPEIVVYRIPEPAITAADTAASRSKPRTTERAEAFRFSYPDGSHDAEALLVHPVTGNLYIVTKVVLGKSIVYEASAPLDANAVTRLRRLGELDVPSILGGVITGGDISPDGRRVALCDYGQGYELVLPEASTSFDEIWKQHLTIVDLGKRKQGEGIAYRLDGKALLATSEGKSSLLVQVVRR